MEQESELPAKRSWKFTTCIGLFGFCILKLFSILKNKENKKNGENTFGSQFCFILKNIENTEKTKFR